MRRGEIKKKELVNKLRSQGKLKNEKKSVQRIENKESFWRNYRENGAQDSSFEEAENPRKKSAKSPFF